MKVLMGCINVLCETRNMHAEMGNVYKI